MLESHRTAEASEVTALDTDTLTHPLKNILEDKQLYRKNIGRITGIQDETDKQCHLLVGVRHEA